MSAWKQLRCRTRVRIFLVMILGLLLVSDYSLWLYLQGQYQLATLTTSALRQSFGLLISGLLVSIMLLIAIWCRVKGMRGFLLAWLVIGLTGGVIAIVAISYNEESFPRLLGGVVLARLAAWAILTFARDIPYFLSYNYDDRPE
jgi:hypothetical protein